MFFKFYEQTSNLQRFPYNSMLTSDNYYQPKRKTNDKVSRTMGPKQRA